MNYMKGYNNRERRRRRRSRFSKGSDNYIGNSSYQAEVNIEAVWDRQCQVDGLSVSLQ